MQEIKPTKVGKTSFEYETFDVGSKAILLDESKKEDVFSAIDELGLTGQKQLVKGQSGNIIPFPKMTATEVRVWEEYCPSKDNLEDYSATQIPYEILTFLRMLKQQKMFDIDIKTPTIIRKGHIEVWSESREDVDPLVVGVIKERKPSEGDFLARKSYYLIARWGLSLRKYEDIVELSKKNWKEKRRARLQAKLDSLDHDSNEHFNGGFVGSYL